MILQQLPHHLCEAALRSIYESASLGLAQEQDGVTGVIPPNENARTAR